MTTETLQEYSKLLDSLIKLTEALQNTKGC